MAGISAGRQQLARRPDRAYASPGSLQYGIDVGHVGCVQASRGLLQQFPDGAAVVVGVAGSLGVWFPGRLLPGADLGLR